MEEEYVMRYGLNFLNSFGLHPFKSTILGTIRSIMYIGFMVLIYSFDLASVVIKYKNIRSLADSVDSIPSGQQSIVKLLSVVLLRKQFKILYSMVDQKWPDNIYGKELEDELQKLSNRFKIFCHTFKTIFFSACVLYLCKPLTMFSKVLITDWYTPCDISDNYCYTLFLVIQIVYILILVLTTFVFDIVFHAFLFHAYCELEKIKYGLQHLGISDDLDSDKTAYKKFCNIVKYHNFTLKFLDKINDVYYLQLLNHFATIVAAIVFGIFFLNIDGFPPPPDKLSKYIPYLLTHQFQLYMYCVLGEIVYNQVNSISDVIYHSGWYMKRQLKLTRGMMMVMMVSHLKNKPTIGNIWKLNLATFMQVIKTSMSFHAFMQTIYQTDSDD